MTGSRCRTGSGRCSPTTTGSSAITPPGTSPRTTGGRWSGCSPGAGSPGSSTTVTRCPATCSGCPAASGRCSTGSSPACSCPASTWRCSACCWPTRPAPRSSSRTWPARPATRSLTWSTWPSCCPGSAASISRCPATTRCGWPGSRRSTPPGHGPGNGSWPPRGGGYSRRPGAEAPSPRPGSLGLHPVHPADDLPAQRPHARRIVGELGWLDAEGGEPGRRLRRYRRQGLAEIGHGVRAAERGPGPADQFQAAHVPASRLHRGRQGGHFLRRRRAQRVEPTAVGDDPLQHPPVRSEEHTSELHSQFHLVCRLLLEKKKTQFNRLVSLLPITKSNKLLASLVLR